MRAAAGSNNDNLIDTMMIGLRLPVIDLRDMGSSLEVMLISGLNKNFMLYEVISVLEEEGAEVVSASVSTVGDKVFHSLHAQVNFTASSIPLFLSFLCKINNNWKTVLWASFKFI